jgi:hypothetical protein
VSIDKKNRKNPFRGKIDIFGERRHLGSFATAEEASIAYQKALAEIQPNASHHSHAA